MKRLLSLVLIFVLLISLTGCGRKTGVLKAWSGEFSEEKLKSAINEYKKDYKNIVYAENEDTVSFDVDFEVARCSVVRISHVDDKDIDVELHGDIDLCVEICNDTNLDCRTINVPIDYCSYSERWPLWSYLVCVVDAEGGEHYYYFRVDYSNVNNDTYKLEIANNYPVENTLKSSYKSGEQVTIKLITYTEHYYVVSINGERLDLNEDMSDMNYSYYTFTMPSKDVLIEVQDVDVAIPESPQE